MGIRFNPRFNSAKIKQAILAQKAKIDQAVFLILQRVGEQFIRDARSTNTYKDQTGNLRSSIGYVILKNGEQVSGKFTGDKSEGREAAKAVIAEISGEFTHGYVLIVVAGMGYAAAVEAKGYDVLSGSSVEAVAQLKKLVGTVGKKLRKVA